MSDDVTIKNNPYYQNGYYLGGNIVKFISNTRYGDLETALAAKKELVTDLKEQFGWDETHKDVLENLGMIARLKEAIQTTEDDDREDS